MITKISTEIAIAMITRGSTDDHRKIDWNCHFSSPKLTISAIIANVIITRTSTDDHRKVAGISAVWYQVCTVTQRTSDIWDHWKILEVVSLVKIPLIPSNSTNQVSKISQINKQKTMKIFWNIQANSLHFILL